MNYFRKRQEELLNKLPQNSVVYIFSGENICKSADSTYKFSVDRNFYYLTGLDKEDMILELSNFNGVNNHKVYALKHDETYAKWVGARMSYQAIKEVSGVDFVLDRTNFESGFSSLYNNLRGLEDYNIYLDLWQYKKGQNHSLAYKFLNDIKLNYQVLNVKDIYYHLTSMRLIKDELEIENLRKAINITKTALYEMFKGDKSNEGQMYASFIYGLMKQGCRQEAFDTILASGKNATCLHYVENDKDINPNDLVLCDLGATYNNYSADITRTIPVSGSFTKRQKEIYSLVLEGKKLVIENAVVGKTLVDLNNTLIDFYKGKLESLGLDNDVSKYYYHGVSHFLGLDTHDTDLFRGTTKLKPGMVITVEPGFYIDDENIGIRIEDDILITNE